MKKRHRGRSHPNKMHSSRIIGNFRELEKLWEAIKMIRTNDDLDYPPSFEETDKLNMSIQKAKELIILLAEDLELWLDQLNRKIFKKLWTTQKHKNWENRILKEIAHKSYIDSNIDRWERNFSKVYDLISDYWLQILLLIDCLELPQEYRNSKINWARFIGFLVGVLTSIVAHFLIKLLSLI
jgi:hypothetical protein